MTQGFYEQLGLRPTAAPSQLREAYAAAAARLARRRRAVAEQGGDPAPLDLARAQLDDAWTVLSDPARRRRYDAMLALQGDDWTTEPDAVWRRAAGALVHPAAAAAADLLRVATNLRIGTLPPAPVPVDAAPRPQEDDDATAPTAGRSMPVRPRSVTAPPLTDPGAGARTDPGRVAARTLEDDLWADPPRPAAAAPPPPPPRRAPERAPVDPPTAGDPRTIPPVVASLAPPKAPAVTTERPTVPFVEEPLARPGRATTARPMLRVVEGAPSAASVVMMPSVRTRAVSAEDIARLVEKHGYSGGLLKELREVRGLSVEEVSDATRIAARHLDALEREDGDALPTTTFVRGYLKEVSRLLGLDPEVTTKAYLERLLDG